MIAHACVHMKVAGSAIGDLAIGGVAEVAVHPEWRGAGLVRLMLADIHEWLRDRAAFGMLFGNPKVYASSGYVPITNVIRSKARDSGEVIEGTYPHAMVRPISDVAWPDGLIDLRGPTF